MAKFASNLTPLLKDFVALKNSLGIEYKTSTCYLGQLDDYNLVHGNASTLTKEVAEGWALQYADKSTTNDRSWISPIREFGRYLNSMGDSEAYVLDGRFIIQRYKAKVYQLSEAEIQAFFNKCDSCLLRYKALGRPYVLPALYRFLYCCGARCGEARKLKCDFVHLDKGYLDIIDSKNHRDRRLLLSDELIKYLQKYDKAIEKCFPNREYFFPGGYGSIISTTTISTNFRHIWLSAGLPYDGRVKPRAYDFRHHFACANIARWSEEGKNVHAMLPYLMRYMGHASLESTYYYVHLIPDYFTQYSLLTASMEDLIPEVEDYEV